MQRPGAMILLCLALPICISCSVDVRLVDASGSLANVGLLQIKTDAGFGSVCGANPAAADVVCRSLGFAHGTVSTSPCGFYGTSDLCGAAGSPVESAFIIARRSFFHEVMPSHFVHAGHGRSYMQWLRMVIGGMLLVGAR